MPKWNLELVVRHIIPGETFYVPGNNTDKTLNKLRVLEKEYQVKLIKRTVVEGGIKGVRVWRQV